MSSAARRAATLVALAFVGACSSAGSEVATSTSSTSPASFSTASAPTPSIPASSADVVPEGFAVTTVRLTEPDGSTCERCLLLASTLDEHRRGLMGVTSLGGYDGMAFVYDPPKSTSFWMKDTVLPLSIRFYDVAGASLGSFDMDPCVSEPCATYGPGSAFTVGVEVEQGRLTELGFTDTARLELLGTPCDAAVRTD